MRSARLAPFALALLASCTGVDGRGYAPFGDANSAVTFVRERDAYSFSSHYSQLEPRGWRSNMSLPDQARIIETVLDEHPGMWPPHCERPIQVLRQGAAEGGNIYFYFRCGP